MPSRVSFVWLTASLLWCAPVQPAFAAQVQVVGNQAVVANPQGDLAWFDLSQGTNPVLVATSGFIGTIGGIVFQRQYAFLATAEPGLLILDVSSSTNASYVGNYDTLGVALDLTLAGDLAVVAEGAAGVEILDVNEAAAPMALSSLGTADAVSSVQVVSNLLYVAGGLQGLQLYDVTNPRAPTLLGARLTATPARRVQVAAGQAYVGCSGGWLEIVDVHNPLAPALTATVSSGGEIADLDLAGSLLVVANTNGTLLALDISNPALPVARSTNTLAGGATGVRVVGNLAYVKDSAGLLWTVPLPFLSPAAPSLNDPVHALSKVVGDTAVLSVLVEGTPPFSYHWSKAGSPLSDGGSVSGASSPYLVLANVALGDSGSYSVTISNALGQLVSSNLLTVVPAGTPLVGGTLPGFALAVDGADGLVYVAAGTNGLEVFDATNPRWPVLLGQLSLPGTAQGLHLDGQDVFLATGAAGLQLVDATYPPGMSVLGAYGTNGAAHGLDVEGGTVYLADGIAGVQIVDATVPTQPLGLGSYPTAGTAYGVQVVGGVAYVAAGAAGLQTFAVTNPASPLPLGACATGGLARNVEVVSNLAYVAAGSAGLVLVDVSDPSLPRTVGSYVAGGPVLGLEIVAGLAVLAEGTNGVEVVNVSSVTNIVSLGRNTTITNALNLRIWGTAIYVATGQDGVKILGLAGLTPEWPTILASPADTVSLPNRRVILQVVASGAPPLSFQWYRDGQVMFESTDAQGVASDTLTLPNTQFSDTAAYSVVVRDGWNLTAAATAQVTVVPVGTPVFTAGYVDTNDVLNVRVNGQFAFLANRQAGLQVIDCRDPQNPLLVGSHPTQGFAQALRLAGHLAYVAAWDAGLQIFDVADPANPVLLGQCPVPGFARGLWIANSLAYVAAYQGGLQVVDVHNPAQPFVVGNAPTDGFALDVRVLGPYAYVAASQAGLEIFNVSDPLAMTLVGKLATSGNAESLELSSNMVYLATSSQGVQIIDASNPASPQALGLVPVGGDAFEIEKVGTLAYVAAGIGKVKALDVSKPAQPLVTLAGLAGDSVHGVEVSGNYAFLADRTSGLVVSQLLGLPPVPPQISPTAKAVSVVNGQSWTLSAAVQGSPPLTYQWFKDGLPLISTNQALNSAGPYLQLQNLTATDAGTYTLAVSSPYGTVLGPSIVLTVSPVGTPSLQGAFGTAAPALAVAALGQVALLAEGTAGLELVDFSAPANPRPLGSYAASGLTSNLWTQSNLVFLAEGSNGLEIVDVSRPSAPVPVGRWASPGAVLAGQSVGSLAYLANGSDGLTILDCSNPANPVPQRGFITDGVARDVQVTNGVAYVAADRGGLLLININGPVPVLQSTLATAGPASAVRVNNGFAFVAAGPGGVQIINVQNPFAPTLLTTYSDGNTAVALALAGNLLTVGYGAGGFAILDVSNPQNPVPVGTGGGFGPAYGMAVAGSSLFVANGPGGAQVLDLAGVAPLPPAPVTQPANQSVSLGGTAQFSALCVGSVPLDCRWYHNGAALINGSRVSGATSPTLTITNVQVQDSGAYTFVVWNNGGLTNTQPATLSFLGPLQARINAAPPGQIISLTNGLYSENLVLSKSLTLAGPDPRATILDGANLGPVARVLPGVTVTLQGLTVRNGLSLTDAGGGIKNEGQLVLTNCIVTGNSSLQGGGLANLQTAQVTGSVFSNNLAIGSGGALYNASNATVLIDQTTLSGNQAADGGALFTAGNCFVTNSTLWGNLAAGPFGTSSGTGGGLLVAAGNAQFIDCTVSGNSAQADLLSPGGGNGGGLRVAGGAFEARAVTICSNSASFQGGGEFVDLDGVNLARNTIVAGNEAAGAPSDLFGTLTSEGYNLLQNSAGALILGNTVGNLLGLDPLLGPLQDNGGPTWTHGLTAFSPAVDAGACDPPLFDQRGVPRPFHTPWAATVAGGCDIGAFERVSLDPYLIVSALTRTGFQLSWQANALLQSAPTPLGPWTSMATNSPFSVSLHAGVAQFFRLQASPYSPYGAYP